jgi:ferritin
MKNIKMEEEIEKKIKNLKEFIKQKTDQGTANYLSKEVRELCGMVETQALSQHDVSVSVCENIHCVDGVVDEIYGEKVYCHKCRD